MGGENNVGSVKQFFEDMGGYVLCFDKGIVPSMDLIDQITWDHVFADIECCEHLLSSSPHTTSTNRRNWSVGGPMPMRSASGEGVYGVSNLKPEDEEAVRIETVIALRAVVAYELCIKCIKPAVNEHAHIRGDGTSMYRLQEWVTTRRHLGGSLVTGSQCSSKQSTPPSLFETHHIHGALGKVERLPDEVTPPKAIVAQLLESVQELFAAHPPIARQQLAGPSSKWEPHQNLPHQPSATSVS